ncbi:tetraacyldisaccharide 4'-kinase [Polaribacter sp. MED152]|uniref:tetraacyldisaccharide 4'-kinase n=1 Tax=Polaribacter sp. MED152 TaxID=313598 RepID=UPI000186F44D|nr:tetraacyldisaccharide 4'-kinase [Polaribacter sp. MED152]EAQ41969.2 tetraacyldisaccharide 4'-kinase [Polaribacter sp. MED152]
MKFLRFLLFPIAVVYHLITAIRNLLFEKKVFKSTKFSLPVIVVGNLSVGGTGKTPQIEYLTRLLKEKAKIAILSRGYGRKTKGYILANDSHTSLDIGDEPLQYFKKFKNITVAVCEKRVEGIKTLLKTKSPEVILLDDAYQHRKVEGSYYILLTKFNDLFTDDYLLPTGNLRESRAGATRADVIVVTKCPKELSSSKQKEIIQQLQIYDKPVFFSLISYASKISGHHNYTINELKNKHLLLVTGIANPAPLLEFLTSNDIAYTHLNFPDHYQFSNKDINDIQSTFERIDTEDKLILTTEKDYTRLQNKVNQLSYLEIETKFLNNEEVKFNNLIMNSIAKNAI